MSLHSAPIHVVLAFGLAAGTVDAGAVDWKDYARAAMTPQLSFAAPAADIRDVAEVRENAFGESLRAEFRSAVSGVAVEFDSGKSAGNDLAGASVAQLSLVDSGSPGLQQQFVGVQLAHQLDGGGQVSAGIVVAEQQFAAFGLGSRVVESREPLQPPSGESASAAGLRLMLSQPLGSALSLRATLQSKINMQPFQSYRGVFSDPGDFDLPAEAGLSASWALSPRMDLTLGTRHVLYSQLKAFSSYALPERFLSLLGDGTSPEFAWRDLTVYDVRFNYALGHSSQLELRYSTQQQPEPSSSLLYDALSEEFTNRNFALGLSHRFEHAGELHLAASHAPTEYFLGNRSALGRGDAGGEQLEVEARWRVDF